MARKAPPKDRGVTPQTLGAKCESCPFAKNGKPNTKFVTGSIPVDPVALCIGDYPSRDDEDTGKFLTGPAGRLFDETLQTAGLNRQKLAIIPACACRAPAEADHNDLNKAVKCCRPAFEKQTAGLHRLPKLLMGKGAAYGETGSANVEDRRGFVRAFGLITHAPGYAFFINPWSWADFELDVSRFAKVCVGRKGQLDEPRINTRPTLEDLRSLRRKWTGGMVGCDIETAPCDYKQPWSGKDPTRARLKTIGFGDEEEGISIWWDDASKEVEKEVREILADESITKVFFNGEWFDIPVLHRYEMPVRRWEDLRSLRRALSSTSSLSLRYVVSAYIDAHPWKEAEGESDIEEEVK